MPKLRGNCYCKAVEFTANSDDVVASLNCHCSLCRKLTGSAFSNYVGVKNQGVEITKGQDNITVYCEPGSTVNKNFCKSCGTPLFNINPKYGEIHIIYAGSFAEGMAPAPTMNIYCDNKMDWVEEIFSRKNFGQGPE